MNMKKQIYSFLLHYGISAVLMVMLVAIIYMLHVIHINNKVAIELLKDETGVCRAYIPHSAYKSYSVGDTLRVHTYEGDVFHFRIINMEAEAISQVYSLTPTTTDTLSLNTLFHGNSKTTVHIITGRNKLWNLIFNKWKEGSSQ